MCRLLFRNSDWVIELASDYNGLDENKLLECVFCYCKELFRCRLGYSVVFVIMMLVLVVCSIVFVCCIFGWRVNIVVGRF